MSAAVLALTSALLPACGSGASTATASGGLAFTDVSAASGIDLENVSGKPVKTAIPESVGQGAATLDYDGDGLFDFFVVNGDTLEGTERESAGHSALFRNLGDFRFADVTAAAGLEFTAWGHGATAVDFDADGWVDLYVTVYGGPNRFFRNRGDATFEDASATWGAADTGPSTAATFFDADGDGDLDLYVGNFVAYDPLDPPNGGELGDWRGLKIPVGPLGTPVVADSFYENQDGALVQASAKFGFDGVEPSYALGVLTCDYDDDGDVDLFVANDSVANFLFENQGDGRFRDVALERGVAVNQKGAGQACMGVDFGDVDNDGRLDLFVTNFSHDTNTLYRSIVSRSGKFISQAASPRFIWTCSSFSIRRVEDA